MPYGNVPVEPASATGGMDGGAVQAAQYAGLESGLKEIFGEEFAIADAESQRMLLDYLERVTTQNEKLTAILERDPRLAQLFLDLVNGKRNAHSAVARYYGRSLMEPEEGTLEYEEMMSADEERQQEAVRLANDRKEYEENLSVSLPVIEDFCREHLDRHFGGSCISTRGREISGRTEAEAVCVVQHLGKGQDAG